MPNYYKWLTEEDNQFGFHEKDQPEPFCTDVEEVWFSGCHGDVGGGYVRNDERFCLARIPLRWMIRECFATNTGIQFHSVQLKQMGLNPISLYHKLIPRRPAIFDNKQEADPHLQNYARPWPGNTTLRLEGHAVRHLFRWLRRLGANERAPSSTRDSPEHPFVSEEHEDLSDALSDMHDQLQARRFWWILELLPQQQQYQKDDDMCGTTVTMHMGRGRPVPKQDDRVKLHRSVDIRRKANLKYHPKANLKWSSMKLKWID